MEDVLFDIKELTHRYTDQTVALNKISLQIKKGKKIALLGNNGAGKSTLFLHLNGILQPTSGQLLFKGKTITYDRPSIRELRKQIGIVFQDPDSQLLAATVMQDISFGPHNLGLSKKEIIERVEWAMKQTETVMLKHKPTHFLSLGQKKRVAIAGVLAMNPEVLILDEPTAGLDAYFAQQIINVLNQIHRQEKTIILSTHDVNLAYEWADEVVIISNGEVLYQGDPITAFQQEEVIERAHLTKPWVLETFQQLVNTGMFHSTVKIPVSKKELFESMGNQTIKI
ncbi:ATP-binding cassette domain-containing protein [Priestia megaterium]|nr:ATP-binding cassette domain-containing protein [Priestia megaterium]